MRQNERDITNTYYTNNWQMIVNNASSQELVIVVNRHLRNVKLFSTRTGKTTLRVLHSASIPVHELVPIIFVKQIQCSSKVNF